MTVLKTRGYLIACLLWNLLGCQNPSIGPFVDATVQVRSSVAATGSAVESELRLMPDGQEYAEQLNKLWPIRVETADALVAYASSLKAIVDAGDQGTASAQSLAESVKTLAGSVGIAVPPAGVAVVAADAASFVHGHIARVRAARSLHEALVNAQPAVERVAAHFAKDLKDMRVILLAATDDFQQSLQIEHEKEVFFRDSLLTEQRKLFGKGINELTPEDKAQLLELDRLLATTKVWYDPLQNKLTQAQTRLQAGLATIEGAASLIRQWAFTHEQLIMAVREERSVDMTLLITSAAELRELIKRVREL